MKRDSRSVLLPVIVAMLLMSVFFSVADGTAAPALPGVVYNNFGADDSYSTSVLGIVANEVGATWTLANSFTPAVSGYISDIWAALGYYSGDNAVAVALMTDSGGLPGSVLESWDFRNAMVPYMTNNSPVHGLGTGTTEISAGTTYWIAATIPADATGSHYWCTNSIGVDGSATDKSSNGFTGGSWNPVETKNQLAFRIAAYIIDNCPEDPAKTEPGICGCGTSDVDTDDDSTPDCNDGCPADADKTAPGTCGCGVADVDTDGDGTADCIDGCPADTNKTAPGTCGCGVADIDSDGDGIMNCNDNCPYDSNADQTDVNQNNIGDACEAFPDLTGSWSSLKFNANNSTCSGRLKINNAGTANALTFSVAYYLSDNGTDLLGDPIATETITGVRTGRSVNGSLRYKSVTSLTGKYVIAVIDSGNQVIELIEDNNRASQLIP